MVPAPHDQHGDVRRLVLDAAIAMHQQMVDFLRQDMHDGVAYELCRSTLTHVMGAANG